MAQSIKVEVNPAVLKWARTSIGLSAEAAAKKIDVSLDVLSAWELGDEFPTLSKLRAAAKNYKRPLAVFFLAEVPSDFQTMHDFRRLSDGAPVSATPELLYEIRRAHSRRLDALDLAKDLDFEMEGFTAFTTRVDANPEDVAAKIRKLLDISLTDQMKWKNNSKALREWRARVESRGVLVFQASRIPLSEMRGFSISETLLPVIVLNSGDAPSGKVFSLLHEFTHLLLRSGGICSFEESSQSDDPDVHLEKFCNHVAGAAIVPGAAIGQDEITLQIARDGKLPSHEELAAAAKRFATSKEVIARRLLILNYVNAQYYETKRKEFIEEYKKLAAVKKNFAVPHHYKVIGANGVEFTRMVLSAYSQDKITSSELSDLLSMKLKHLSSVESEVFGLAA